MALVEEDVVRLMSLTSLITIIVSGVIGALSARLIGKDERRIKLNRLKKKDRVQMQLDTFNKEVNQPQKALADIAGRGFMAVAAAMASITLVLLYLFIEVRYGVKLRVGSVFSLAGFATSVGLGFFLGVFLGSLLVVFQMAGEFTWLSEPDKRRAKLQEQLKDLQRLTD